jgi:hypothetical protein
MNTVLSQVSRLAQRIDPTTKNGGVLGVAAITSSTGSNPVTVTAYGHGFQTGDSALIAGHTTKTSINGVQTVTRLTADTFTVPVTTAQGDGSAGTATTLCVSDGDGFLKQRLLDIYNDARLALFSALRAKKTTDEICAIISGAIVESQITFTTGTNRMTYALPTGYTRFISLTGFSGTSKTMQPIIYLPETFIDVLRSSNPHYAQTNDTRFIFEVGQALVHYGSYLGTQTTTGTLTTSAGGTSVSGSGTKFLTELAVGAPLTLEAETKTITAITNDTAASISPSTWPSDHTGVVGNVQNYALKYFGISNFVLSDVTGGATLETFNLDYEPKILDVAEKIAN